MMPSCSSPWPEQRAFFTVVSPVPHAHAFMLISVDLLAQHPTIGMHETRQSKRYTFN